MSTKQNASKAAEPLLKPLSQRMAELLEEEEPDYNTIMIEQIESGKRPISQTAVKEFLKSPRAMYEYYFGESKEDSAPLILGKAYEIMLMEPDRVDEMILTAPPINRRTKEGKAQWEKWLEHSDGRLVLTSEQMDVAMKMWARAQRDKEVQAILENVTGVQERVYYTHKSGIRCVAVIDFRTDMEEKPFKVIDLKTMGGTAAPNDFSRQSYSLKYWLQGGAYFSAYRHEYFLFPDYYWLVAETSPPYDLNYFKADSDLIREGERVWDLALQAIKFCCENRYWHLGHKFWRIMADHDTVRLPAYHQIR